MATRIPYPANASAEERALIDYKNAGNGFLEGGAATYSKGDDLAYEDLSELDRLGPSNYGNIQTDSRYDDNEMEALRQLEEQSRDGYSAQDKADLARITSGANTANRGRQGAIQAEMDNRGLNGSGLDFVMKQQAAQDAAEHEALAALEVNAQSQNRKQEAASRLGNLSSQLKGQDFAQQAQKAAAADNINRFNTQNSVSRQIQNNQGQNQANQTNWQRTNQVADNNVNADYGFRKDTLGVKQDAATKDYDYATDLYNRQQAEKSAKAKKKAGMGAAIGGVAGTAAGAYFGGPAGAAAGASAGSALGGAMFAHGGKVPGPEVVEGDDYANDVIPALLSAGEIVVPKSHASNPHDAAKFVANVQGAEGEEDLIGSLLSALSSMHGRKK